MLAIRWAVVSTAQWSSRMIRASGGFPRHVGGEDVRDPGSIPG